MECPSWVRDVAFATILLMVAGCATFGQPPDARHGAVRDVRSLPLIERPVTHLEATDTFAVNDHGGRRLGGVGSESSSKGWSGGVYLVSA